MNELFEKNQYGCLWYKNIENDILKNHEGLAITKEQSLNVSDMKEISKQVFWWTNLPLTAIWNLGRYKTFKPNNFFGFNFNHLVLMFCKNQEELPEFLSLMQGTFSKLGRYWSDISNMEREVTFSGSYFSEHFSQENKKVTLEIEEISKKSYLDNYIVSSWEKENGLFKVPLFFMPSVLLDHVLQQRIPDGEYTLAKNSQLNFTEWLLDKSDLWLAKINHIEFHKPHDDILYNRIDNLFLQRQHKNLHWFTKNEVLWLKENAKIDIESAYIASSSKEIKIPYTENWGPLAEFSLVHQLWCASWLQYLSTPLYHPETRNKNKHTPEYSFIKSYLRGVCVPVLNALNESGFKVHSYGNGQITVWAKKESLAQLGIVADHYGMTSLSFMQPYLKSEFNLGFTPDTFQKKAIYVAQGFNFIYKNNFQKHLDNLIIPLKIKNIEASLSSSAKTILELKNKLNPEQQKFINDYVYQQLKITVDYLKNKGK